MTTSDLGQENTGEQGQTLGNDVEVRFSSVGNKTTHGKVDTGATTSSLHATNISVNKERNSVSFSSAAISDNVVTMDLEGGQAVHSADGGAQARPTVKFDIEINGTPIQGALFNLNDRGNMDTMVLIGQNVLKAGNFVIDVNKDTSPERVEQVQDKPSAPMEQMEKLASGGKVNEAMQVLFDNNVTLTDMVTYYSSKLKGKE
jgi:hypothetical protein